MDDYISKPIRSKLLYEKLQLYSVTNTDSEKTRGEQSTDEAVADWSVALEMTDGDEALLQEVVETFIQECPRMIGEIQQAVDDGDAKLLHRSAHTIKSSLQYFGAQRARELANELESMGESANLATAPEQLSLLNAEIKRLMLELTAYVQTA